MARTKTTGSQTFTEWINIYTTHSCRRVTTIAEQEKDHTWLPMCVRAKSLLLCPTLYNLWTVARQTTLSMGFSRQEYWSELPCPPPGDLPDPRIESRSPVLQVDSLPLNYPGSLTYLPSLPTMNPASSGITYHFLLVRSFPFAAGIQITQDSQLEKKHLHYLGMTWAPNVLANIRD